VGGVHAIVDFLGGKVDDVPAERRVSRGGT
jgi:hypothetical protein